MTAADKVARCARYDNERPAFDPPAGRPHLLLFEKINGFKDEPSVNAAHAALLAMTDDQVAMIMGWSAKRVAEIRARYVNEERVIVSLAERLSA